MWKSGLLSALWGTIAIQSGSNSFNSDSGASIHTTTLTGLEASSGLALSLLLVTVSSLLSLAWLYAQYMHTANRAIAERDVALRQSQANETQLQLALQAAHIGIWNCDLVTGSARWTVETEALFGMAPGTFDGRYATFVRCLHPDDREGLEQAVQLAIATHSAYHHEYRIIWADGSIHWLAGRGQILYDHNRPVQITGTVMEISAAKRSEADRHQAELALRQYERVVSSTTDGMALIDRAYTYRLVNQRHLDWHQKPREAIVGHTVSELMGETVFQSVIQPNLDRCLAGETIRYGVWFDNPTGDRRFVNITYSPYLELDGTITGVVVHFRDMTDLKQAEADLQDSRAALQHLNHALEQRVQERTAALHQSEARFQYLATNIPGVLHQTLKSRDGTSNQLIYVNAACRHVFELEPAAIQANLSLFWSLVVPEDVAALQQAAAQSLEPLQPLDHEYRIITPSGYLKWIHTQAYPEEQPDGMVRWDGVSFDITDRKQAETALRQSEARFQHLAANIPGVFYQSVIHADGSRQFSYLSSQFRQVFEIEPEALLNDADRFWAVVHPDDLDRLRAEVARTLTHQEHFQLEYRILPPSGRVKWIHNAASREYLATGDIISDGVVLDITDRKQAEAALQISEHHLRTIFNNVQSQIWVHDAEGTVFDVNDRVVDHIGMERDQLLQCSLLDLHPPATHPTLRDIWRRVIAGEPMHFEWRIPKPGGDTILDLDITLNRILWNDQAVILANVEDIGDRKEAERLLQRQADANQLLAVIAQTINQSMRLDTVLEVCLEQTRQFLQCDRVLVCRFDAHYDVIIELEAVSQPTLSLLGMTIRDPCFGADWAERYRQGYVTIRHDMRAEDLAPCYADMLTQMQVRANLVVAILQADRIWGLLIVHQCQASRQWQPSEVDLLKQLGLQIGIADQKASLYTQLEAELAERRHAQQALAQQVQREQLLRQLSQQIRQSLRLDEILTTTVTEVRQLLNVDRALIFRLNSDRSGVVIKESLCPEYPATEAMYFVDEHFPPDCQAFYQQGQARAIADVTTDQWADCLVEFMAALGVKSKIVAPILQVGEDGTSTLWGLLIVHACADYRYWQPVELDLLQQLATQVGIAIQQAELYTQIENQLVQKEILLKEVHHRVKNNLQVISSMLWLQANATRHTIVFDALADTRNRLQAMALIHETLYESTDLGQLNFHDYIQRLVNNILAASSQRSTPIAVIYRLQPTLLSLETAIPCGLLLNELVTNAVKHAFPNEQPGEVRVTLEHLSRSLPDATTPALPLFNDATPQPHAANSQPRYVLTVQDNGVGIPDNLNLKRLKSLGLKIAYDLAMQLRGSLELERTNGTQFRLTFSALEYRKRF